MSSVSTFNLCSTLAFFSSLILSIILPPPSLHSLFLHLSIPAFLLPIPLFPLTAKISLTVHLLTHWTWLYPHALNPPFSFTLSHSSSLSYSFFPCFALSLSPSLTFSLLTITTSDFLSYFLLFFFLSLTFSLSSSPFDTSLSSFLSYSFSLSLYLQCSHSLHLSLTFSFILFFLFLLSVFLPCAHLSLSPFHSLSSLLSLSLVQSFSLSL